ncbi:hypothetical protein BDV96DRAFT_654307 [Lophiotrema nucula]|uniref:Uncharacterized protein n=1 Tax=Lophiotrema nucula TaxID=690887 RepID=A0A6A5YKW4_9PLEO|nr:hypothetical protein BDV96DRAFT_654307 [Lophiotrema nucula]
MSGFWAPDIPECPVPKNDTELINNLKALQWFQGQSVEIELVELIVAFGGEERFEEHFECYGVNGGWRLKKPSRIRTSVLSELSNQFLFRLESEGQYWCSPSTFPNPIFFPIKLPVTDEEIASFKKSGVYNDYVSKYGVENDRRPVPTEEQKMKYDQDQKERKEASQKAQAEREARFRNAGTNQG